MESAIHSDPSLLLIQPANQQKATAAAIAADTAEASGVSGSVGKAERAAKGSSVSGRPGEVVLYCLQFLAVLLRNCVNKHVFSSSEVCARVLCFVTHMVRTRYMCVFVCFVCVLVCSAWSVFVFPVIPRFACVFPRFSWSCPCVCP